MNPSIAYLCVEIGTMCATLISSWSNNTGDVVFTLEDDFKFICASNAIENIFFTKEEKQLLLSYVKGNISYDNLVLCIKDLIGVLPTGKAVDFESTK